jgi:hypothetical protein
MPKKTHTHKNKSNFQNMQNKIEHTNKNHFWKHAKQVERQVQKEKPWKCVWTGLVRGI